MKKTSASDTFQSPPEFALRLKELHQSRRKLKLELRDGLVRKALSVSERGKIRAKTGGQCHVCGGPIEGNQWEADHVSSHSLGGKSSPDNYLPADSICNGCRWFYQPEEIQWILKLGVWLRKQIEDETKVGKQAAQEFCKHDCVRASRRKKQGAASEANPIDAR
jgi:hypothetical protein